MRLQRFFSALTVVLLVACSEIPVKSGEMYKISERARVYAIKNWSFEGRLAVSDGNESWSAAIEWAHTENKDEIKLSGPLGQGAAMITLTDDKVIIDKGDDKIQQSAQIDALIAQQLGMIVPVRALRFWVLGLPQADNPVVEKNEGFEQANWQVHYVQMQQSGNLWLPRKMNVENQKAKLKLVIDQWVR